MRNLFIIVILIAISYNSYAQSPCTENGVSTNPINPVNPGNPSFVNTFDWMQESFPVGFSTVQTSSLTSPFFNTNNLQLQSIWDWFNMGGTIPFYPEDGWELIKQRFGPSQRDIAYLVLYNKYSSIMRVFCAVNEPNQDYSHVNVELTFNTLLENNVSNLLNPVSGQMHSLDMEAVKKANTSVPFTNSPYNFFMADFTMAYDVCTCLYKSKLNINFKLIREETIDLYGRTVGYTDNLATITNNHGLINKDFLSSLYSLPNNGSYKHQAGNLIFSTFNQAEQYYYTLKRQYTVLEAQYLPFKIIKDISNTVGPMVPGSFELGFLSKIFGSTPEVEYKDVFGKGLGAAVDFFSSGLKTKLDNKGAQVQMLGNTTLTQSEVAMTGTMTTSVPVSSGIHFNTPGSKDVNNTPLDDYPMYNEVLGKFAVLEKPQFTVENHSFINTADHSGIQSYYAFKYKGGLKYRFNPAAHIDEDKSIVKGAIVVKIKMNDKAYNNLRNFVLTNITLISVNQTDHEATFVTPFLPLNALETLNPCISAGTFQNGGTVPDDSHNGLLFDVLEVDLRLLNLYDFNAIAHDGKNIKHVDVLTYPGYINKLENTIATSLSSSDSNFGNGLYQQMFMNNTWLTQIIKPLMNIDGDIKYLQDIGPYHFNLSNNYFAWSQLNIMGNISVTIPYKVEMVAGNSVYIRPGTRVSSGVSLKIREAPLPYTPTRQYNGDITSFCTSAQYKARVPADKEQHIANTSEQNPDYQNRPLYARPNPASGIVNLNFELEKAEKVNLTVYDVLGNEISKIAAQSEIAEGYQRFTWDATDIPNGVYIATLETENGRSSVKILVQHP